MSATTAALRSIRPSLFSSRKGTVPTRSALTAATAQPTLSAIRPCERTDYSVDGDRPLADRHRQRRLSRRQPRDGLAAGGFRRVDGQRATGPDRVAGSARRRALFGDGRHPGAFRRYDDPGLLAA